MDRYSRQKILPTFGEEGQLKLQQSKVLIIGAGGLGVPVLQYLSSSGIGTIGIVDGDIIELSNLHRQVIYNEVDIGRNKAEMAYNSLSKKNSEIEFQLYKTFINKTNVFEIMEPYDIVVDCTDNFSARYLINDTCSLLKKPLVFAAIFQFEGQLSVFHFGEIPYNLRDVFPEIPSESQVPNCNEAGVIGILPGIIGCFQANEVIKMITGIGVVNNGKLMFYNSLRNEIFQIEIARKADKFLPISKQDVLDKNDQFSCEILNFIETIEDLNHILSQKNSVLIDVRDFNEKPEIIDFPSKKIPLDQIAKVKNELFDFETIVFVCKSGIRSVKAIEILKNEIPNKRLYTIKNGIRIFEK